MDGCSLQRYIGTETEFGVKSAESEYPQKSLSTYEAATAIVRAAMGGNPTITSANGTDRFTVVGGRCYVDTGSHPEYATPEEYSPRKVVTREIEGENYIINGAQAALEPINEMLATQGKNPWFFEISKDTTVSDCKSHESWGAHENYQTLREAFPRLENEHVWRSLAAHLVTRVIYTGAGGLVADNYWISPRAIFIRRGIGVETTSDRPIVNTRDEPLADGTKYRRLHVISGDGNISPWQIHMKLGTTALIVKAMEAGARFDDLCPEDPVEAFRTFGQDVYCNEPVLMPDDSPKDALAIQNTILERVRQFAGNQDEEQVIEEWERVLVELRNWRRTQQVRRVGEYLHNLDWFIKLHIIRQKASPELPAANIVRQYAKLTDSEGRRGIGLAMRENGRFKLMPDVSTRFITTLRKKDLGSGRARIRARYAALENCRIEWGAVRHLNGSVVSLPDHPTLEEETSIIAKLDDLVTADKKSAFVG